MPDKLSYLRMKNITKKYKVNRVLANDNIDFPIAELFNGFILFVFCPQAAQHGHFDRKFFKA